MPTFANGESNASVRTKINDAITLAESALQPGTGVVWGHQNFQDVATQSTPIALTAANTWYDLTNDGAGALSSQAYAVAGHGPIWDTATNRFDFSDLKVGDMIAIRFDVLVTTGGANHALQARINFGTGFAFSNIFHRNEFKSATVDGQIFRYFTFFMLTADTQANPARLQMRSDATGDSVKVNGWAIETYVR